MKITDSGAHLSPWRQRVLPVMMMALRALVAWIVLRTAVDALLHNPLVMSGHAPQWLRYVLAAVLAAGGLAFIWSRTVVAGAVVVAAGLGLYEYLWRLNGQAMFRTAFLGSLALLFVLALGEWLARRVQKKVYGSVAR